MNKYVLSFLLVFVLTTSASFANNYFTPGTRVKWNLDDLVANSGGDVTFSAGVYNVNDTIYIALNDTLYITSNATVKFAAGSYLDINGTLIINPPTSVLFTAQNITSGFLGLRIDSSNTTILRKLTLEYAVSLRLLDCNPTIDNCVFQYNNINNSSTFGNGAVALFRSSPSISNSQFLNNLRGAIQSGFNNNNAPKITGNFFMGNGNSGTTSLLPQINLSSTGSDTAKILNNIFLRGSVNAGAISFFASANCNAVISGNIIKNNRFGINVQGGSNMNFLISYNVIDSNNTHTDPNTSGSGIAFSGGSATSHQNAIVTGNLFRWNFWGVTIQNGAKPNLGNLTNTDTSDNGKNQFIDNTNAATPFIDLYNNSPDPIFAQGNYWNTNEANAVEAKIFHQPDNATLGLVDYANFTLPVDLANLSAAVNRNNVMLHWQTKSESNSDYFVIEKSDNGQSFYSIGKLAASGTSTSAVSYNFTDHMAQFTSQLIYYRLKLVDKDGRYKYSQVVSVRLTSKPAENVVKLYPTVLAASHNLAAEILSNSDQIITIQFFSTEGRLMSEISKQLFTGNNRFTITPNAFLPGGWVYVKFYGKDFKETKPVLIY